MFKVSYKVLFFVCFLFCFLQRLKCCYSLKCKQKLSYQPKTTEFLSYSKFGFSDPASDERYKSTCVLSER